MTENKTDPALYEKLYGGPRQMGLCSEPSPGPPLSPRDLHFPKPDRQCNCAICTGLYYTGAEE